MDYRALGVWISGLRRLWRRTKKEQILEVKVIVSNLDRTWTVHLTESAFGGKNF